MNRSHHRVPLSLQALDSWMDRQLFCLSFPEDHAPCPCFHSLLWITDTSGTVLELGCSVSLRRVKVRQLKPSLKSGGHHACNRAPSTVLGMMHWDMTAPSASMSQVSLPKDSSLWQQVQRQVPALLGALKAISNAKYHLLSCFSQATPSGTVRTKGGSSAVSVH